MKELPAGLIAKGASPTFRKDTVPHALTEKHSLAANRWGVLHVLEGQVVFVDLVTQEEHTVTAPDTVIIEPEAPHHLRLLDGPLSCRIDFYKKP